jgi:hypothetical protein
MAEEINFNIKEANQVDKCKSGFLSQSISSTFRVAQHNFLETDDTLEMIQSIESSSASTYYAEDEVDAETVESHTTVKLMRIRTSTFEIKWSMWTNTIALDMYKLCHDCAVDILYGSGSPILEHHPCPYYVSDSRCCRCSRQ